MNRQPIIGLKSALHFALKVRILSIFLITGLVFSVTFALPANAYAVSKTPAIQVTTETGTSGSHSVQYSIDKITVSNVTTTNKEKIENWSKKYTEDLIGNLDYLYNEQDASAGIADSLTAKAYAKVYKKRYVSITIVVRTFSSNMGGVNAYTVSRTLDIKTGKNKKMKDFVKNDKRQLNWATVYYLKKQNPSAILNEISTDVEYTDKPFLHYDGWNLEAKGVRIWFGSETVANRGYGAISALIPWNEICTSAEKGKKLKGSAWQLKNGGGGDADLLCVFTKGQITVFNSGVYSNFQGVKKKGVAILYNRLDGERIKMKVPASIHKKKKIVMPAGGFKWTYLRSKSDDKYLKGFWKASAFKS